MEKRIKTIIAIAMALIAMSSLTACNSMEEVTTHLTTSNIADNTQKSTEIKNTIDVNMEMPQPFEMGIDAGGEENDGFYLPFNSIINGIPVELIKLRDKAEVDNWINSFPSVSYAPSNISEYANIYSFITDFSITKDEAETALNYYLDNNLISYEQLNLIYSGDKELITKTFASKYSIVIGESIYCPNWIYTHSIDDYSDAGITTDKIDMMASIYSDFTFTEEARKAFEGKLSLYSNKTINIKSKATKTKYVDKDDSLCEVIEDEMEDVVDEDTVVDDVVEVVQE